MNPGSKIKYALLSLSIYGDPDGGTHHDDFDTLVEAIRARDDFAIVAEECHFWIEEYSTGDLDNTTGIWVCPFETKEWRSLTRQEWQRYIFSENIE